MWDTVREIGMHLERITTFTFMSKVAKAADKKPAHRPFDQVLLDAIVQVHASRG